jgi:hypothetical protein
MGRGGPESSENAEDAAEELKKMFYKDKRLD